MPTHNPTSYARKGLEGFTENEHQRDLRRSGEGGIRTPDAGITDVTVFETAAFNHSATSPRQSIQPPPNPSKHPVRRPLTTRRPNSSPIHHASLPRSSSHREFTL